MPTARAQLVAAAFELFAAQGYDATTVDDIAARAGVGRTTFFRTFRGKDEVVFPDHAGILASMQTHLDAEGDPLLRAREAARAVLRHFLAEGEVAAARYRLTSTVPALRDRELASIATYQRVLGRFFLAQGGVELLEAELLASAWVTVHNHVLRRHLQGKTRTPEQELATALDDALARLSAVPSGPSRVVVFTTDRPVDSVLPRLRRLLGEPEPAA